MRAIKQRHSITIKSSQFLDCLIGNDIGYSPIRFERRQKPRADREMERWCKTEGLM